MTIEFILILSAILAFLIPFVFITTRESTKIHRQGVVADLSAVFDHKETVYEQLNDDGNRSVAGHRQVPSIAFLMPSFEFVKYKYFLDSEYRPKSAQRSDFVRWHWIAGSIPVVLMMFAMNSLCLLVVVHVAFRVPIPFGIVWLNSTAAVPLFAWVSFFAYAGGVLYMLRAFNQAINNFDFSPFSLIGAFVNLMSALASGLLLVFGVLRIASAIKWDISDSNLFPLILISAFTAGYFPDAAIRNIVSYAKLRFRKGENEEIVITQCAGRLARNRW